MPRRHSALVERLVVDQPWRPQQAILDELRRVIPDGAVPPGSPIPLAEVADLFGVSQIPVRESLKTLIGEGLVAHRRSSGYTIAQLTRRSFARCASCVRLWNRPHWRRR
jgi:DNA-binding GntR family transcriptional regulator